MKECFPVVEIWKLSVYKEDAERNWREGRRDSGILSMGTLSLPFI